MTLAAGGDVTFLRPDGSPIPDRPPVPRGSTEELIADHRARGLHVDAETPRSEWDGAGVDLIACGDAYFAPRSSSERYGDRSGESERAGDGEEGDGAAGGGDSPGGGLEWLPPFS